ncbi:MAG TPA: nuclear transport factor 2 family protein [Burkholderiales bacterium]|nr:nuclear transport factor 2 family protein [Burkholderiales bacterium]
MILNSRYLWSLLTVTVACSASAEPGYDAPAKNGNVAKPVATAPTADALLALEKRANQAYIKGDGKFFERLLSDKFVMQRDGARLSKAEVVTVISGIRCDVKDAWALRKPQMLKVDDDAYVLTYQSRRKRSCMTDGNGPVRVATLWVRSGSAWRVAFHGENPIVDPKAAPAANKNEGAKNDQTAAHANSVAAAASATASTDPITDALMSAENSVWDAWMTHDTDRSKNLTAKNIAFVDLFGSLFANKDATIKDWTSSLCQVKSFALTNGVGTAVLPTVGILTLTGTVVGTCGGQDISGQKIYGNSVYVKEGGVWKWVFGFNSPS